MKRRLFLQAAPLAAAFVPPLAVAQQQQQQQAPRIDKLPTVATDDAAAPVAPRFFTAAQFATLRKLCEVLQPAGKNTPGAIEAGVAEFLDFHAGESPAERQQTYRAGLDLLKGLDDSNAVHMLAPLKKHWTYEPPKDPLTRFLQIAKQDIRAATQNSREWAKSAATNTSGRRGFGAEIRRGA